MIEEVTSVNYNQLLSTEYVEKECHVNPYAHFLVYKVSDNIIGYLYYSMIYDRVEINQIEVLGEYRRKGIGSKLLSEVICNNPCNITLEVRVDNKEAIGLYEKFYFRPVAIRKGYYKGVDAILMERKYEGD